MAFPGVSGSQAPAGEDWLVRRVADLERVVRELGPSIAKSFAPVIARLDATDADLIAKQAAIDAQQATLTTTVEGLSAAVADIATNLASINTLIGQVVQAQSIYLDARNFGVTTSWVTLASSTITVPAGFTSAKVTVTSQVGCYNPHTTGGSDGVGSDFLLCRPYVGAVTGNALGAQFPGSNWWGNAVTLLSTVLTGLTGGGTFSVGVQASVDYANMAAFAANEATLSGDITWYR